MPRSESSPVWVAAELIGQGSFDGTLAAAGRLVIDAGLERGLGGVLDVGLETARSTAPRPNVQVSAWLGFATLLGRYRFVFDRLAFEVGLGVRLFRLEASGHGNLDDAHSSTAYVPSGLLGADLNLRLGAGFFLTASLQAFLRFWSQQVEISGLGTVLTLQNAGVTAGLGLGYRFR